jgi:hypothetical protein
MLYCHTVWYILIFLNLSFKRKENEGEQEVKQSSYRPGKALRVPGGTGS